MDKQALARFDSLISRPVKGRGCWLWRGGLFAKSGYAQFALGSKPVRAHKLAYLHWRGPIEDGLVLDHLCRVRHCVNPWHLEAVSTRENVMRGIGEAAKNVRKTHCPKGHPYAGGNLYTPPGDPAHRMCRLCLKTRRRAATKAGYWKRRWQSRLNEKKALTRS